MSGAAAISKTRRASRGGIQAAVVGVDGNSVCKHVAELQLPESACFGAISAEKGAYAAIRPCTQRLQGVRPESSMLLRLRRHGKWPPRSLLWRHTRRLADAPAAGCNQKTTARNIKLQHNPSNYCWMSLHRYETMQSGQKHALSHYMCFNLSGTALRTQSMH